MIFNAEWRNQFDNYIKPRLSVVHPDLSRMAAWLRDPNVDIWTESPSDSSKITAGRQHFSLEGWRVAYKVELANLTAFNNAHGTALQNFDAQAKTALDGYIESIPRIGTAFNAVMGKTAYRSAGNLIQRTVTQIDRDQIATAIEAELQ